MRLARFRFPMLLIAVCLALPISLFAQSKETLKAFEQGPQTGTIAQCLVGLEVVNVLKDGTTKTLHGNGLVLRPDGFILAPTELFRSQDPKNPVVNEKVRVFVAPGTETEKRFPVAPPRFFGQAPLTKTRKLRLSYTVLKLADAHLPALRTLLPATLNPDDTAQLAWSAWDDSKKRFLPLQQRQITLGPVPKDPIKIALSLLSFTDAAAPVPAGAVVLGPEDKAIGMLPDASATEQKEFVTMTLLGLATNCITPLPVPDRDFLGLLSLRDKERRQIEARAAQEQLFDVGLPPLPAGRAATVQREGGKPTASRTAEPGMVGAAPEMVYVPGGPIRLPDGLREYQPDMDGATVACVAPFLIDRYEVTNRQYYAFWKSLPPKQQSDPWIRWHYYPVGWAESDPPFSADVANVPVLGVRTEGARAYATWMGKRLPTPYEWCLAAYGPKGETDRPEWVQKYITDRQQTWKQVWQAHIDFIRQNGQPQIKPSDPLPYLPPNPPYHMSNPIPWLPTAIRTSDIYSLLYDSISIPTIRKRPNDPAFQINRLHYETRIAGEANAFADTLNRYAQFSHDAIVQATEHLYKDWIDPIYILPVGSRAFDVSPYGAMDMILNADELIMPGPEQPYARYYRHGTDFELNDYHLSVNWLLNLTDQLPSKPIPNEMETLNTTDPWIFNTQLSQAYHIVSGNNWLKGPLPFFSRRIRNATQNIQKADDTISPYFYRYIKVMSTILETCAMLRPLSDWQLTVETGTTYDTNNRYAGQYDFLTDFGDDNPLLQIYEKLWGDADGPYHAHQETGQPQLEDQPTRGLERHLEDGTGRHWVEFPNTPESTYVLPIGFRCVR